MPDLAIDKQTVEDTESVSKQEKDERTASLRDAAFAAVVSLLCSAGYVHRLGFYVDDWSLVTAGMQGYNSVLAVFRYFLDINPARPVQIFLLALLCRCFGTNPLGYHVVNAVLQAVIVSLLYVVCRQLRQPRNLALALAVLFGLLPHYSADRFVMSTLAGNWSILFFLLSFAALLRAFENTQRYPRVWTLVSLACVGLSVLTYEVTLGLFVLFPVAVVWRQWADARRWSQGFIRRVAEFVLIACILGGPVFFLKLAEGRIKYRGHFFHHLPALFDHAMQQVVGFDFWNYGLRLPWVTWKAAHFVPSTTFLLAIVTGVAITWYMLRGQRFTPLSGRHGLALIVLGCVVFFLGFGLFFANLNVDFRTTGLDSRLTIASAPGAALVLLGAIEWGASWWKRHESSKAFFGIAVAIVCVMNLIVVNGIATGWQGAYERQLQVLSDIRQHVASLPPRSALLLDKVCPYEGPGIAFESEFSGAMQMWYGDPTLLADVVSPRLRLDHLGLTTTIYDVDVDTYPYGDKLWIYNFADKRTYPLPDIDAARRYFAAVSPRRNTDCPGQVGRGAPIF